MSDGALYGLLAEFEEPDAVLAAAKKARQAGYRRMDAYSPFPVEGLGKEVGSRDGRLPAVVLSGGVLGALSGYALQYYVAALSYPLNVGGRPLNSWPAFVPVAYEMTLLFASLAAVFGLFFLSGLPRPYHPAFNVPEFERASRDRFFLCIESEDILFDEERTRSFLRELGASHVADVPY